MNEKIITVLVTIIIIIAVIMIYRIITDLDEKVSELKIEVNGQFNKMEKNINTFTENVKSMTSDNIEQLRKIMIINRQLENTTDHSNILVVSDTATDNDSYYMSRESEINLKETDKSPNLEINKLDVKEPNLIPSESSKPIEVINDEPQNEESSDSSETTESERSKLKQIDDYRLTDLRKLAKKLDIPISIKDDNHKLKYLSKVELYERIKNFSK